MVFIYNTYIHVFVYTGEVAQFLSNALWVF